MSLYILVTIISLLIAYKIVAFQKLDIKNVSTRQSVVNRIYLAGLFTLLFALPSFRIYTGNDYHTYVERFHDIYYGIYVVTEKGFNVVVKFIYWLFNSECFLVVFALFAGLTVIIFLEGIYKQSSSFLFSFFLFMMLGLYFQCFNTVRYYFALSIVFYSMQSVIKQDYVKFLIITGVAVLFHKSALVVIPAYIIAKQLTKVNWGKWVLIGATLLSPFALVFKSLIMDILVKLYPSYRYEEEYLAGGQLSIINVIRCVAVLALCLYCYKDAIKDSVAMHFYFVLNYAALLLYLFFYYIPFVSRIGYYFNICHILLIPGVICRIKDEKKRKIITGAVIGCAVLYFAVFLYKAYDDSVKILPYMSWLFEDVQFTELVDK